jgi:nitric oxide synthase-interacting protein
MSGPCSGDFTITARIEPCIEHSKNNTAPSIFSYAERKELGYGTEWVRVLHFHSPFSNDHRFDSNVLVRRLSMRRFDACALCPKQARDSVATKRDASSVKCVFTQISVRP